MKYIKRFEQLKNHYMQGDNYFFIVSKDEKYLLLDYTIVDIDNKYLIVVEITPEIEENMFNEKLFYDLFRFKEDDATSFKKYGNLGKTLHTKTTFGEHQIYLCDNYEHYFKTSDSQKIIANIDHLKHLISENKVKPINLRKEDFKVVEYARGVVRSIVSESLDFSDPNLDEFCLIYQDYNLVLYNKNTDKIYAMISLSEWEGYYTFPRIAAERGYGKIILRSALMFVGKDGLLPSRDGDIRETAFDLWKKISKEKDVVKDVLPISSELFNFAIITGEEDVYNNIDDKLEEFYDHTQNNKEIKNDIVLYNTKLLMSKDEQYKKLLNSGRDIILSDRRIDDFFSEKYN
jgi:hypothetical protein